MGNIGPKVIIAAAAYLVIVGAAQYYSGTSTNSPTADSVAKFPSLGTAEINLIVGGAILVFHKQIVSKIA